MRGWVYVMTNEAMPGLIKVGMSGKDPFDRAKELAGTHSPHAFIVEYDVLVHDPYELEQMTHRSLEAYRENGSGQGSEFFRCSVYVAVMSIRNLMKKQHLLEAFHKADREAVIEAENKQIAQMEAQKCQEKIDHDFQLALAKAQEEPATKEKTEAFWREEKRKNEEKQKQLHAEVLEAKSKKKKQWLFDQENRINRTSPNALAARNALRLLHEGSFAICIVCNRPCIAPFKIDSGAKCDGCGNILCDT